MGNFDNYYKDSYGNEHRDIPLGTSPADAYVRTNMKLKKEVKKLDDKITGTKQHIDTEIGRLDKVIENTADNTTRQLDNAVNDINETIREVSDSMDTRITSEVSNINRRVDNIIANSTSTEGNSELIDIRTGADGTVYGSAGEAIRQPIISLASKLNSIGNTLGFSEGNHYQFFVLEQGHLHNGVEFDTPTRVRSTAETVIEANEATDITITNSDPSTYKCFICIYTSNGEFYNALAWRNLASYTYSMQPGYKYRFVFSKIDNTNATVNEISSVFQYIVGEQSAACSHKLDDIDKNQTALEKIQNQLAKNSAFFSIAHQGFHQVFSNQTLDSFIAAGNSKFNWLECDAAVTSDGVIICCHNNVVYANNQTMRINPTLSSASSQFNIPIEIASTAYQELCRYDIAKWKNEELPTQTFATLEDVIKTAKYYNIGLVIDDFYRIVEANKQEDFTALIRKYGMENKIAVITVNPYIAQNLPKAKYFAAGVASTWQQNLQSLQTIKNNYGSECWLNMKYDAITEEVKTAVRNADIGLLAWTVNDLSQYKALLGYVDGITSDSFNYYDSID